jgi:hypothetical protein
MAMGNMLFNSSSCCCQFNERSSKKPGHGHGRYSHEEQEEKSTSSRSIEQDRKAPAMALQQVMHAMATGVAPSAAAGKGAQTPSNAFSWALCPGRWVFVGRLIAPFRSIDQNRDFTIPCLWEPGGGACYVPDGAAAFA